MVQNKSEMKASDIYSLPELLQHFEEHPRFQELRVAFNTAASMHLAGLKESSSAFWVAMLYKYNVSRQVLCVLDDVEQAGYFYHDISRLIDAEQVLFLPISYRRSMRDGQLDETQVILRTEVLSALQQNRPVVIVTHPEALGEPVVSRKQLDNYSLALTKNQTIAPQKVVNHLVDIGFERVAYVYHPGQVALRGSILDIFSYSNDMPYRVDFFGDDIDSIRTFAIDTQLSVEMLDHINIVPSLVEQTEVAQTLFDLLDAECLCCMYDMQYIVDTIAAMEVPQMPATKVSAAFSSFKQLFIGTQAPADVSQVMVDVLPQPMFHKNFELVMHTLQDYFDQGYELFLCSDSEKQHERLHNILEDREETFTFHSVAKTIHAGFVDETLKCCYFTDHQMFDRYHKYSLRNEQVKRGKAAVSLKELTMFELNDFVVHIDHGVGRFAGLVRLPQGDSYQEAIKLVYANGDTVFVSIHSLHKISKYKGKEGDPPRLSKLGTGAWQKLKERKKSKLKDIARDLIKLYAQRRKAVGYAFSRDSFLQQELEASFRYEDTPDQLKTTQDVKRDMERSLPMDRLVCGDVGFGKTEIAIRAAFKAVADDKQVAILVPTTVLAYQHYQSFKKRLDGLPCRVDYLSRARSAKQRTEVLTGLKEGEIQIVIGTHQLLNKNVQFKDLGLLVIDEEQRFGAGQKEKLKQMRVNVDTLTLTATPIPRTLQFSLIGARDLSIISTPPPNRRPIQTEVHPFNPEIIADAVRFELSRNGQVFFVHNRIDALETLKAMIVRDVPDCRVCIGHGQMKPQELEDLIVDFVNHEYDLLLATTIIESGIDMPNVNTIIVNDAHHFGLSALHQLRGRVGRSDRKAFCYLLAPPMASLPDNSRRRLQAIENYSDLGSGIHIAMQDLDIRGAGNLLGAEQSGFIADLGYETYQKILTEAVQELKIEEFAELYQEAPSGESLDQETQDKVSQHPRGDEFVEETLFESDYHLNLPVSYVPGNPERMLLYRELDGMHDDEEVTAFRKRLEDRFGPLPPETEGLLHVVPLRRLAAKLGIERVSLKNNSMYLFFVSQQDSAYYMSDAFAKFLYYAAHHPRKMKLREKNKVRSMHVMNIPNIQEGLRVIQEISEQTIN